MPVLVKEQSRKELKALLSSFRKLAPERLRVPSPKIWPHLLPPSFLPLFLFREAKKTFQTPYAYLQNTLRACPKMYSIGQKNDIFRPHLRALRVSFRYQLLTGESGGVIAYLEQSHKPLLHRHYWYKCYSCLTWLRRGFCRAFCTDYNIHGALYHGTESFFFPPSGYLNERD